MHLAAPKKKKAQEKESPSTLESEPQLRNPAFSDCVEYPTQGDHSFVDEDFAGTTSDALLKSTAYVIVKVTEEMPEGPLVSGLEPAPSTSKDVGTQANTFTKRKLIAMPMQPSVCTQARRIVSLESLQTAMTEATFHTSVCGKGPVFLKSETKTGMYMEMSFTCGCGKTFAVKSDGEKTAFSINEALVWGNTQSAIGYNASVNLLTTMELPTPSFNYYKKFQQNLHDEMTAALKDELKRWAKMEFELAKAAGDIIIINGKEYALITVVVDGGWVKRSYQHSFSSNCGVAVIVGARTKKVLYFDTRISTCATCDRKREVGESIPAHACYKNWTGAPNGMESDIILAGFQQSMEEYNLIYWKFIGDGDSSVHSKVQHIYGKDVIVEKVECTNHVTKNFTKRLVEISEDTKIPLWQRKLFNPNLQRFKAALKQSIIYHHGQNSDWMELYNDIKNMPFHIFGDHTKCKEYFCKGPKEKELNSVPSLHDTEIWKSIQNALERPASLAQSLIKKESSNYAESFMSIASKYVEGKRKNFGQNNLYRLRMGAAVFAYNECEFWVNKLSSLVRDVPPSDTWKTKAATALKERQKVKKYRLRRPLKVPKLGNPSFEYGANPQKPDLPDDILMLRIMDKKKQLQISTERIKELEAATREQANSELWKSERFGRITASKAGAIFRLQDKTDNTATLNDYFGRKKFPSAIRAMQYGTDNEARAIEEYASNCEEKVSRAGFTVYSKNGIFGASPDAYVGDNGLLEVKCPFSLHLKDLNKEGASAWPSVSSASSLQVLNGKLEMKKKHPHYYQVIMQLYVTDRSWCDYMVWSETGKHVIIRISISPETDKLWIRMQEKLEKFWMNDLAPELVDSRFDRGYTEYKCPSYRLSDRVKKSKSKKNKCHVPALTGFENE